MEAGDHRPVNVRPRTSPETDVGEPENNRTDSAAGKPRPDGKREFWDHLALVSQVGLTMGGSVVIFLISGYYLDQWLGAGGILIVLFILLGIAGGGYTVYRQIMTLDDGDGGAEDEAGEENEARGNDSDVRN